jgi:hypothetical protein
VVPVRDEKRRRGRYDSLKVVSADSKDPKFGSTKVVDPLRAYERDNGLPGLVVPHWNASSTPARMAAICQVFPVVGPDLTSMDTSNFRLYPSFVRGCAQQLAYTLDNTPILGVCHRGKLLLPQVLQLVTLLQT